MYKITCIVALIVISTLICTTEGKKFYEDRELRKKTSVKIYDISHKYLPDFRDIPYYSFLENSIIFLPLMLKNKDKILFARYIITIMIIRALFTVSTILPKHKKCNDDININTFIFGHCYDKMFSGHFAFVFLFSLIVYNGDYNASPIMLTLLNTVNAFIILTNRSHYSIDILTSLFVTSYVFQNKLLL